MKTLMRRAVLWTIIIILMGMMGISFYVTKHGKEMLTRALSKSLKRAVEIGSVSYRFPFGISARDVVAQDQMKAKRVDAQFGPDSFFSDAVSIRRLTVTGGAVQYLQNGEDYDFSFDVDDIVLTAQNLIFPVQPGRAVFELTGRLIKDGTPLSGSRLQGRGWIDWARKDMESNFKVTERGGRAGLTVDVVSKNNNMKVDGDLNISRFAMPAVPKQGEPSSVNDMIFEAIGALNIAVNSRFSFETKMDNFHIGDISFSGQVERDDLSEALEKTAP